MEQLRTFYIVGGMPEAVSRGKIIPIEVKANTQGKMQSLHLFMEKHGSAYGIRTSLENISSYTHNSHLIKVVPIYTLSALRDV